MGSAPKGCDSKAQGAALGGEDPKACEALKGRDNRAAWRVLTAPTGLATMIEPAGPQGFALVVLDKSEVILGN